MGQLWNLITSIPRSNRVASHFPCIPFRTSYNSALGSQCMPTLAFPDISIHSYLQIYISYQLNTFILCVLSMGGDVRWLGDWFWIYKSNVKVKVKQSHYRPGQARAFHEVEATRFRDNRHMKVPRLSALHTGRLSSQKIFLILVSVGGWVDPRAIVWPKGLWHWQILTPSGIDHATFRFVSQSLNNCATACPIKVMYCFYLPASHHRCQNP
jgi:hypothetical protein